jgi:hypothetical protein
MSFPVTPRFFFKFRRTDTGLTPTFTVFKNATTLVNVTAPAITEFATGVYYFDYVFTTVASPEILYEVDGGAGLPSDVRYVNGTISPREFAYLETNDTILRCLGLLHENSVMDSTTFTSSRMTGARVRIYDSQANAAAASAVAPSVYDTGKLAQYLIAATYSGADLQKYTVTRTA